MNSWGHEIREQTRSWFTGRWAGPAGPCRVRKCPNPAEVFLRSLYRTGRAGRVAERHRAMCRACAQKALEKAQRQSAKDQTNRRNEPGPGVVPGPYPTPRPETQTMPRGKKNPTTTRPKATRRARKAETETPAPLPQYSEAELAILAKYPNHTIKPGSFLFPEHPDNPFKGKRIVTIVCSRCKEAERPLPTSDLFHCDKCVACTKEAKKEARRAKSQKGSGPSA